MGMQNLTDIVLLSGFGIAFGVFGLGVLRQVLRRGREVGGEKKCGFGQIRDVDWGVRDLVAMGLLILLYMRMAIGAASAGGEVRFTEAGLVYNIVFFSMVTAVVLTLMQLRGGVVDLLGLVKRSVGRVWIYGLGAVLVMLLLGFGLFELGYEPWLQSHGFEVIQPAVKALQQETRWSVLSLLTLSSVVVAPVCEEIVFRGFLYGVMKKYAGGVVAAVVSSLVFAAAHGSVAVVLPLFVFGLLLVIAYERTGSIWSSVLAHACFNGLTVMVQLSKFGV